MSIYDPFQAIDGFSSAGEGVALCGYLSNPYDSITAQALVKDGQVIYSGLAVEIKNNSAQSSVYEGRMPDGLEIDKVADSKVDGFVLESEAMLIENGTSLAPAGSVVQIAMFGSGVRTFLPCETDLSGVNLSQKVYYNKTNKTLTATSNNNIETPLKLVGSAIKGKKRTETGWADCNCIEVQF